MDELFSAGRICRYCAVNMDSPWVDIVKFLHATCWQEYRKNGELYPMPRYAGFTEAEALGS